jgi:hypothetical protein
VNVTVGFGWHFWQTTSWCLPVSCHVVTEWSNEAGRQADVTWQAAQLWPKNLLWEAGPVWHAAHVVWAPAKVTVGFGWHFWQTTRLWAPVSFHGVTEWSNEAGRQSDSLWQEAQLVPK